MLKNLTHLRRQTFPIIEKICGKIEKSMLHASIIYQTWNFGIVFNISEHIMKFFLFSMEIYNPVDIFLKFVQFLHYFDFVKMKLHFLTYPQHCTFAQHQQLLDGETFKKWIFFSSTFFNRLAYSFPVVWTYIWLHQWKYYWL